MSRQDPLREYMEKRLRRASLALTRVILATLLGLLAGLRNGVYCILAPILYVAVYASTVYLGPWSKHLDRRDNITAGILSSPAALLLGYFLGSVL